jgi:hypothetical protein
MNTITYPVTVFYLHERPRPGDGATIHDALGKLVCVVPLHDHARVIVDALNEYARQHWPALVEVQP